MIAFGQHATGLMATDQALAEKLKLRAKRAGSCLAIAHGQNIGMVKSDIADVKNTGTGWRIDHCSSFPGSLCG